MRKASFISLLFLTICAIISNADVWAGGKKYDDFASGYLDGKKWFQRTYIREIDAGKYVSVLGNRSPGMSAEVLPGIFRNHLPFAPPPAPQTLDDIKSIQCEVSIAETKLDSAGESRSGAMIIGYFYNKNGTGSATGDILALMMIGDVGNSRLEAVWVVVESLSEDAQTEGLIGSGTITTPAELQYGTPYKIKLDYDNEETFRFSIFIGETEYFASFTGPVKPETNGAAVTELKSLSTGINAVNGSNTGYVSATFDDVVINDESTVYDDFETIHLDMNKWNWSEFVRDPSNGYLQANIIGYGSTRAANTVLTESDAPYVEAKVCIDSGSQLSEGAWGIGRLQGYYYNENRGTGSGQPYNKYQGDVFAQVRLRLNDDRTLTANAYVDRTNDADETDSTNLFAHDFSVPIVIDTCYTLSIRYEDKKLIFGCNGETAVHNITTQTYPAYGEHRLLRSRVHLDPGETGYMKVRFDDVFFEKKIKSNASIPLLLLSDE